MAQGSAQNKTKITDGSGNIISSTANALDINIKSGNPSTITATQGTGSNLHTVVDSGAVTATLNAETTKVIGVTRTADGSGNLLTSTSSALDVNIKSGNAPSTYANAGAATKANVKASAGAVYSIYVTNSNASVRYFQLHNKATAPAAADTAQLSWIVPAGTVTQPAALELTASYFGYQETFTTGIGFAISTTDTTFTDSGTASDHTVKVRYS